jgi:hypothetical protein
MNGTAISSEQTGVVVFRQTFIQKQWQLPLRIERLWHTRSVEVLCKNQQAYPDWSSIFSPRGALDEREIFVLNGRSHSSQL